MAALRHADPADRAAIADGEQKEAAEMDGAGFSRFIYLTLPHLARAITVVILIQTIFLLGVYAEILVTTNGGPGYRLDQPALPDLQAGARSAATSAARRPAASSRSSSPTSSPSS
jgi:ABC-type sugar transport system permease subunit